MKLGEDHDLAFEISMVVRNVLQKYSTERHHAEVVAALMDVTAQVAMVPGLTYEELEAGMRDTYDTHFLLHQTRIRR